MSQPKQLCAECEPDCPCDDGLVGERCYDRCSMCSVICPCRSRVTPKLGCGVCDPSLVRMGPRKDQSHVAVRFGAEDAMARVWKNGEQINDVYEIEAPWRAWRAASPARGCPCGSGEWARYLDEDGGFTIQRYGEAYPHP